MDLFKVVLKQYRTIEQMCSDAHSITLDYQTRTRVAREFNSNRKRIVKIVFFLLFRKLPLPFCRERICVVEG